MELTFTDGGIYIPEWMGNKKKPEDEQIKVHWIYATNKQKDKIKRVAIADMEIDQKSPKIKFEWDYDALFRFCLLRIENLKINGEEILTGEQLQDNKFTGSLYSEVKTFLISNMEVDEKTKKK